MYRRASDRAGYGFRSPTRNPIISLRARKGLTRRGLNRLRKRGRARKLNAVWLFGGAVRTYYTYITVIETVRINSYNPRRSAISECPSRGRFVFVVPARFPFFLLYNTCVSHRVQTPRRAFRTCIVCTTYVQKPSLAIINRPFFSARRLKTPTNYHWIVDSVLGIFLSSATSTIPKHALAPRDVRPDNKFRLAIKTRVN